MKSFEYTLPLDETIEGRALSGSADSCLDGRLCSCEVRMLNPRKVFTRVNVELTLTPYVPASLSVCSGVKEQEAYKIETLCEEKGHRYYPRHSGKGLHAFPMKCCFRARRSPFRSFYAQSARCA